MLWTNSYCSYLRLKTIGFSSKYHCCNVMGPCRQNTNILEFVLKNCIETYHDGQNTVKGHKETLISDLGSKVFYKPLSIQTQMLSGLLET